MAEERILKNNLKVVKYNVEEECMNLRRLGLGPSEIAKELNKLPKVPDYDKISSDNVIVFLNKFPALARGVLTQDKRRLSRVIDQTFDAISEVGKLYEKTKSFLETYEENSKKSGVPVKPSEFKAISSEMRELLKQMMEIQKDVSDYNNIKTFMEIVIKTLKEECPEKIPIIVEQLKLANNTAWFSSLMGRS